MDGFGSENYVSSGAEVDASDGDRIVLWDPVTESRTYLELNGQTGAQQLAEAKMHIRNHQRMLTENIERLNGVLLKMELKKAVHCLMLQDRDECRNADCDWDEDEGIAMEPRRRRRCHHRAFPMDGVDAQTQAKYQSIFQLLHPRLDAQLTDLERWIERLPDQVVLVGKHLERFRSQHPPAVENDPIAADHHRLRQLELFVSHRVLVQGIDAIEQGVAVLRNHLKQLSDLEPNIVEHLRTLVDDVNRSRRRSRPGVEDLGLTVLEMYDIVEKSTTVIEDARRHSRRYAQAGVQDWEIRDVSRLLGLTERPAPAPGPRMYGRSILRSFENPNGRSGRMILRADHVGKEKRKRCPPQQHKYTMRGSPHGRTTQGA